MILHIIRTLGVNGGTGYAYEYGGSTIEAMSMEERMTICNMSIEGGARCGYVNPDETTFAYLEGPAVRAARRRPGTPPWRAGEAFASDPDARYDDVVTMRAEDMPPTVTWGINPGQAIAIDEHVPTVEGSQPDEQGVDRRSARVHEARARRAHQGHEGRRHVHRQLHQRRLSDFREVARHIRGQHVAPGVKALVVPGSQLVDQAARAEGLDEIFRDAGFEWREAGCSMCLAMNPDKLIGDQLCASSSNRNFKGRQGSPTGRTVLMSPVMVAAAAVAGEIADAREVFGIEGRS